MMKARLRLPSPQEIHGDAVLIARVIGVLYAAGAVLVGVSLLLPHPAAANEEAIIAIAATAALGAALLFGAPRPLPRWLLQLVIAMGTVLICLCVYFSHQPGAYAAMFVWVVLVSGFFFPGRPTALQLIWLLGVYAVVLYSIPSLGYSPLTRLLLTAIAYGTAAGVISWLSGATMRRVEHSEARARTDPLTGVANRRWLDQELSRELAWARRHGSPLCAAIIDLDDFKRFNDEHGHLAGDRLLVSVVEAWRSAVRPSDLLARVGGDEFMLVMPECPVESARAVLERIAAATPCGASCSAGLALWHETEGSLDLFQRADTALYAAKRDGGSRVVLAESPRTASNPAEQTDT
jgi:diguanylate cyclase (GGDEF)-like protein